jgi:hypothetical protein
MVRKHQTRNLEIPGSMLRIAPERQREASPFIVRRVNLRGGLRDRALPLSAHGS